MHVGRRLDDHIVFPVQDSLPASFRCVEMAVSVCLLDLEEPSDMPVSL